MESPVTTYVSAARSFSTLVHRIPGDRWDGTGLGEWDLRALVGHTSRAVTTVAEYLGSTAERVFEQASQPVLFVPIASSASSAEASAGAREAAGVGG